MKRFALVLMLAIAAATWSTYAKDNEPLSIAKQGYMFAGARYSAANNSRVMSGQIYAEFQIPSKLRRKAWIAPRQ